MVMEVDAKLTSVCPRYLFSGSAHVSIASPTLSRVSVYLSMVMVVSEELIDVEGE